MRGAAWLVVVGGFAPFLYVAGLLFSGLPVGELFGVVPAYLATFALGVYYLWARWSGDLIAPIGILAMALVFFATAADPAALAAAGAEVSLGFLAAAPLVLLLIATHHERGPGARLVGLQLGLLDALGLLAAHQFFAPSGPSMTASNLVAGYLTTIRTQFNGLEALVTGGSPSAVPLSAVNDPTFVALAGLAVLATLVAVVRPATGRGASLPTVPATPTGRSVIEEDLPEQLTPSFRTVLRSRSVAEGPPRGEFPGLPAFGVGIGSALVFLTLLFVLPRWVLLITAVGALLGVAMLVGLLVQELGTRRRLRRTAGPPAPMVAESPSETPSS